MMQDTPLHIARMDGDSVIEVLDSYEAAYGYAEVAAELWKLAGRTDRAAEIDDVFTSAYELKPARLDEPRIVALRGLLNDLEPALVGTLTDDKYMLSREKVDELRGTAKTLDFNESYGADARRAVQTALSYVDGLRGILDKARDQHACILFD